MMKDGICTAIGVVGSVIASLFGGWDAALVSLAIADPEANREEAVRLVKGLTDKYPLY